MKSLVVYDSAYGNTAKVAAGVGDALAERGCVTKRFVGSVTPEDIMGRDLIVVGSPTQGGRPTKLIEAFIDGLSSEAIDSASFATFDTRFDPTSQKKPLQLLMKVIGYAAPKMAKSISRKGGTIISDPQGFIVDDQKGPLRNGEFARAKSWAKGLVQEGEVDQ